MRTSVPSVFQSELTQGRVTMRKLIMFFEDGGLEGLFVTYVKAVPQEVPAATTAKDK
jgi:hypothetical protein